MSDLNNRLRAIEARLDKLELNSQAARVMGSANAIILDKEHDRVMHEMGVIEDTYSGHQAWREEDRARFRELRKRRDEIRKQLGIQH